MSITTIGDHFVHYEALGRSRGQPSVVLIHGWLGSWRYWWPSMQVLSKQHRTFSFDLWGYGDSQKFELEDEYKEKYSIDGYVAMLGEFMETLGIPRPAVLIGHGLGGVVALRYAMEHPEDVDRVACIALPISGQELNERLLGADCQTVLNRVIGKNFPELENEIKKADKPVNPMNVVAQQVSRRDFLNDIEQVDVPLMLLFGDQDPLINVPDIELPQSKDRVYLSLDGCQHFPMLEDGVRFNRLLQEFIHANGDVSQIEPKNHWVRRNR